MADTKCGVKRKADGDDDVTGRTAIRRAKGQGAGAIVDRDGGGADADADHPAAAELETVATEEVAVATSGTSDPGRGGADRTKKKTKGAKAKAKNSTKVKDPKGQGKDSNSKKAKATQKTPSLNPKPPKQGKAKGAPATTTGGGVEASHFPSGPRRVIHDCVFAPLELLARVPKDRIDTEATWWCTRVLLWSCLMGRGKFGAAEPIKKLSVVRKILRTKVYSQHLHLVPAVAAVASINQSAMVAVCDSESKSKSSQQDQKNDQTEASHSQDVQCTVSIDVLNTRCLHVALDATGREQFNLYLVQNRSKKKLKLHKTVLDISEQLDQLATETEGGMVPLDRIVAVIGKGFWEHVQGRSETQ